MITGTNGFVSWNQDGNTLTINEYEKEEIKLQDTDLTNDTMFYNQARYFIENIGTDLTKEHLKIAKESLELVEASKKSMETKSYVSL